MDVITVIEKFGIPVALLIGIAVVWRKDIWPFIITQLTRWQDERTAERVAFVAALAALNQTANDGHALRTERDLIVSQQIEALAKAVQQVAVLVQETYNYMRDDDRVTRAKGK